MEPIKSPRYLKVFLVLCSFLATCQAKPNVVIIMADDMGSYDASFRGSNQVLTPNIDALAYNGVILDRFYTPAMCTPSRSSTMTGKEPSALGMQSWVIQADEAYGLSLNEKLMSNYFKDAGYSTHLIGKWHLGHFQRKYTPNFRGFDSFLGYFNGGLDYYNYTWVESPNFPPGYDFRRNTDVNYLDLPGKYATELFTDEAVKIINSHDDAKKSLFLMVNHLAVHAGNTYDPLQAPAEEVAKFNYIDDPKRKYLAAMLSKLDESVGKIVEGLKDKGILNNTIVMFFTDNGAPTAGLHSTGGSNHPFRGQKNSPWEGASRNIGLIYSPLIKLSQRVYEGYFHNSDILPTLASAAGIKIDAVSGFDQWDVLSNGGKSPRKEIVNSLDNMLGFSAIISGGWKFINGTTIDGIYDGYVGELQEFPISDDFYSNTILNSRAGRALNNPNALKGVNLTPAKITNLRKKATVACNEVANPIVSCNPLRAPCLFSIIDDPCERTNLAALYPSTVANLKQRMDDLVRTAAPSRRTYISDPRCSPDLHLGNWEWWIPDSAF